MHNTSTFGEWICFYFLKVVQMNTLLFFLSCLDATPELNNWILQMKEDPSVKALMFSLDTHKAFFTSFMNGNPNYDYGLWMHTVLCM